MRNRSILMDNNQKNNKKGLSLTEYEIVLMAFGVALESLRTKSWYTLAGGEPIPVYGDGLNVRDWLYVEDNCRAIDAVLCKGAPGSIYNVGGGNEISNIDPVHLLLHALSEQTGKPEEEYARLITFVADRPGHDQRYALDSCKLCSNLDWATGLPFMESLRQCVLWQQGSW